MNHCVEVGPVESFVGGGGSRYRGFVDHVLQIIIQQSLKSVDLGTLIVSNAFMKYIEQFRTLAAEAIVPQSCDRLTCWGNCKSRYEYIPYLV